MKRIVIALCCMAAVMAMAAQESPLRIGVQAGIGMTMSTGSLHDNFGNCATFSGGLTADYKRLRLKADVDYGQPSFRNNNIFDVRDATGRDAQINSTACATQLGVGVQAGYAVIDRPGLRVTPCAGLYYSHYGWDVNNIEWDKDEHGEDVFKIKNKEGASLGNANWTASVDIDIKLHSAISQSLLGTGNMARTSSWLRITPWVAQTKHDACVPPVKGCLVGLTLRYSGMLQSLGM